MSVVEAQGDSESWILYFIFSYRLRLVALVRPQIFFSRTLEKLGHTCDQIGRTLEPCNILSLGLVELFVSDVKYCIM